MNAAFAFVFLGLLAGVAIVFPLYFFELSMLHKSLKEHDPDILEKSSNGLGGKLSDAYAILSLYRDGQIRGIVLSNESKRQLLLTRKLLYAVVAIFMVFLFMGLGKALIDKGGA